METAWRSRGTKVRELRSCPRRMSCRYIHATIGSSRIFDNNLYFFFKIMFFYLILNFVMLFWRWWRKMLDNNNFGGGGNMRGLFDGHLPFRCFLMWWFMYVWLCLFFFLVIHFYFYSPYDWPTSPGQNLISLIAILFFFDIRYILLLFYCVLGENRHQCVSLQIFVHDIRFL